MTTDPVHLFGRGAEQERLRALLEGARNRHSGSLVLVGEPGAGKSALIEDVRAGASDMTVLEARGVESEAELPFASLHQLLLPTLDLLERLPAPQASALRAAFGLGDGDAPDLYRVPLAVLTLLAEAAEDRPLLCLVDDARPRFGAVWFVPLLMWGAPVVDGDGPQKARVLLVAGLVLAACLRSPTPVRAGGRLGTAIVSPK